MQSKKSMSPIYVQTLSKIVLINQLNLVMIFRPYTSKKDSQKTKAEPICDEKLKPNSDANYVNILSRPFSELSKYPSESRVLPSTEKLKKKYFPRTRYHQLLFEIVQDEMLTLPIFLQRSHLLVTTRGSRQEFLCRFGINV